RMRARSARGARGAVRAWGTPLLAGRRCRRGRERRAPARRPRAVPAAQAPRGLRGRGLSG
ncbi:hypothetical protein, partial [Streptomyces fungicidicus]|uniref:hypothetical protein n=1 Tax=Streptomyces fungicidicus TaxID=68203 RepID=UPI003676AF68